MKFSYSLIKSMFGKAPSKMQLADGLNLHSFEAENLPGDLLEISLPANRYSDASSHLGIAREAAAIFGLSKANLGKFTKAIVNAPQNRGFVNVKIEDSEKCPRYSARYFEIPRAMEPSPAWLKKYLETCGLKPINLIVDLMNYVMLEVGQPLHAFDAGLLHSRRNIKEIVVRSARKGEKILTLDGQKLTLDPDVLVIADSNVPAAIAGIKGGEDSGIKPTTVHIIVEAANFESMGIYKTSRKLKLQTDASLRFSHGLSPELTQIGLDRATVLLKEIAGAKLLDSVDIYPKKQSKEVIAFSVDKFNKLSGISLSSREAAAYLEKLDFKITKRAGKDSFLVEVPKIRLDISIFEDLAEEVMRLYGYERIKPAAPLVGLAPSHADDSVALRELVQRILSGLGLTEVYRTSFSLHGEVEVQNPISEDKKYLRCDLKEGILENLRMNARFFDGVRIFEIGKTFSKKDDNIIETSHLAIGLGEKKGQPVLELKGMVGELFSRLGLTDYLFREENGGLRIESDHLVLGKITVEDGGKIHAAVAEIDFDKLLKIVVGEKEYEPLPRFPSSSRDLSLLIPAGTRAGDILEEIQNASPIYVDDADLIDYFEDEKLGESKKSLTFRIVFRSLEKTLTDSEVDGEVKKITGALRAKFGAEIR